MKTALTKTTILASLLVVASAWMIQSCSGDDGSKGDTGAAGAAGAGCTAKNVSDGVEITCGSDTYQVYNGAQGAKGEGVCTVTPGLNPSGQSALILDCGDGPQYITQGGGSGGSVDCKLVVSDNAATAARQTFGIQCGESEARIGFCLTDLSTGTQSVYNPRTEKCQAKTSPLGEYEIVAGKGKCAGVDYVMAEKFCQNNSDDTDDEANGVRLQPVCGSGGNGGLYRADQFCFGFNGVFGSSSGKVVSKCGTGVQPKEEYKQWQFCQNQSDGTQKVVMRCGFKADSLLTLAQFTAFDPDNVTPVLGVSAFLNTHFCQAVSNEIMPFCNGKEYTESQTCLATGEIGGFCNNKTEKYSFDKAFCAEQDDRVYAFCDTTSANRGKYNPTTNFCYSKDYATNGTEFANKEGKLLPLCGARYLLKADQTNLYPGQTALRNPAVAGDPVTVDTLKNVGYSVNEFCSNGSVYSMCNYNLVAEAGTNLLNGYPTSNYSCDYASNSVNSSTPNYSAWELYGRCGVGTLKPYKLSAASCQNTLLLPYCGTSGRLYDGNTPTQNYQGVTYEYDGRGTQTCSGNTISCKATIASSANLVENSNGFACACPTTGGTPNYDPNANECVATCPAGTTLHAASRVCEGTPTIVADNCTATLTAPANYYTPVTVATSTNKSVCPVAPTRTCTTTAQNPAALQSGKKECSVALETCDYESFTAANNTASDGETYFIADGQACGSCHVETTLGANDGTCGL